MTKFLPGGDLGFAVIFLTLLIRMIIFPLNHRMIKTQRAMKIIEPEVKRIQSEVKNKEEQGRALMELYRKHGINPLSGIASLFVQLPLLIALFKVFQRDIMSQATIAYSFISLPTHINTIFLGFIDLTKPFVGISIIAAGSQFLQAYLATPPHQPKKTGAPDFNEIMQKQMKYVFPIMIFLISFKLPSAVALYWTVMNVFAIVHEAVVRRRAESLSA